jgi:proteasome lid subunit RPN8/RPN11
MTQPALVPGLNRRVRNAIYDHIFENDDHEVGGILVGHRGTSGLPVITAAIPALEADGQRASVTFTHEAWAEIHAKLDRDYPEQQIVGWYHSHPGFGIFLSEHDRFIHANFFSDPHQVAYVVDPHAGTEGVFTWQNKELRLLEERSTDRPGTGLGGSRGIARTRKGRGRIKVRFPWQYGALALLILVAAAVIVVIGAGSHSPRALPRGASTTKLRVSATTPDATRSSPATGASARGTGPTQAGSTTPAVGAAGGSSARSGGASSETGQPGAIGTAGSTGSTPSG